MLISSDEDLNLRRSLPWERQFFSYGMTAIALLFTSIALLPLFSVFISILQQGLPLLKWEVFTALPAPAGMTDIPNGFANAILGTLLMVGIAAVISIPVGVITAVFLSEFSQGSAIAGFIRFVVTVLSGVPSIVVGVFAYSVIVLTTKQFSAWAGGFALGVIMLPIVVLSTESALNLVSKAQRLGSAALGGSRFQTTRRIVLASATPGIVTGALLAIARAAGETAPLIFTALYSDFWPAGLNEPTPSMSVFIYNRANSPFIEQNQMAWTAALVLVAMILAVNLLSRFVTRRLKP